MEALFPETPKFEENPASAVSSLVQSILLAEFSLSWLGVCLDRQSGQKQWPNIPK